MIKRHYLFVLLVLSCAVNAADIKPVSFTQVHFTDDFWNQRLSVLRNITVPYSFKKCDEAGQIRNFEYAGKIVSGEAKQGELTFQSEHPYDDAEVYKTLEGAAYLLSVEKDVALEMYCDEVIDKICSAQEPDGYIQTNFTIHNPLHSYYKGSKWTSDWETTHETFNVAELIESAVAYYYATGKDKLLKCAIRAADNMIEVFNNDGLKAPPGHAVIEMALVRLYELTGEQKYLDECKFFLDCRGLRQFDTSSTDIWQNGRYWQDHMPAKEQRTAEGHAVRALYFYSGIADWVRYSGDKDYEEAISAIWNNIDSKKFYITGGLGARGKGEAFGEDYELPNATAYCETCASIADVMFNERMFRLYGDSKYIDMLERALYNTVLDGMSIYGTSFFYQNHLEESDEGAERSEWFSTSCCPTNLCRLIPSITGYVYATDNTSVWVNLYVNSTATFEAGGATVSIEQETGYPYEGTVKMKVKVVDGASGNTLRDIRLRIPGWAENRPVSSDLYSYANPTVTAANVSIDGAEVSYTKDKGYAVIPINKVMNGVITIELPMDVHQVVSSDSVTTNRDLRSYERGPIVYCAEGIDNGDALDAIYVPENPTFTRGNSLNKFFTGGVVELQTKGMKVDKSGDEVTRKATTVRLIPYFARSYRGKHAMKVWIPVDEKVILGTSN